MTMVDPLADMYTRIRNDSRVKKETVDIPVSKIKLAVAEILIKEGFISTFKKLDTDVQGVIRIKLKYDRSKRQIITNIKQVSRPGLRYYVQADDVPRVLGGMGIAIVSTSDGLLTDTECRQRKVGGELLCKVW